jgi:hypothetical protein
MPVIRKVASEFPDFKNFANGSKIAFGKFGILIYPTNLSIADGQNPRLPKGLPATLLKFRFLGKPKSLPLFYTITRFN